MPTAATDTRTTIRAALPGGWRVGAETVRDVHVRPVNVADELFLLDNADTGLATRANALLERCIVDDIAVESLTVGDREALLLQLRRVTLGDELDCVVQCPVNSCGEQLELHFAVDAILLPPYEDVRQEYSTTFTIDGREHRVQFRPPSAADLAAAAAVDVPRGAATLLSRCVIRAVVDGQQVDAGELDTAAVARIDEEMAARDPQAEIQLEARCTACGHQFDVLFDTGSYLLRELEARANRLLSDVHILATHYHWSEQDILGMPSSRRDRYLDLLAAEFAGQPT